LQQLAALFLLFFRKIVTACLFSDLLSPVSNQYIHMNIKSMPLNELTITAILYVYNNGTDDQDCPDLQFEVVVKDAASHARWQAVDSGETKKSYRCSCCGHSIRWASIVEHIPTGTFLPIGRQCAEKMSEFARISAAFNGATVALQQRAESNKREAAFRASTPGAAAALDWAKTGINRTAKDLADKIRKYGSISEKQAAFLVGLYERDVAYRQTLTGVLVAGKQTISGVVVSTKVQANAFRSGLETTKALIQLTNGCKVWGTAPEGTVAGASVTFSATVELSDKDPAFGFYKRPTKWTVAA
jgi:hypothetical protein